MPRLRVTAVLSLLGLLVGILGTGWLSGFTDDWVGPPPRHASQAAPRLRHLPHHRHPHAAPRVVRAQPEAAAAPAPVTPSALVPLDTPPAPATWAELRGHLDGRVVLAIATDGHGQVRTAAIARSSGDTVLDAYAVTTVRQWRFAVPPGAAGVQGELPMRFDSTASSTPP